MLFVRSIGICGVDGIPAQAIRVVKAFASHMLQREVEGRELAGVIVEPDADPVSPA